MVERAFIMGCDLNAYKSVGAVAKQTGEEWDTHALHVGFVRARDKPLGDGGEA